MAWEKPCPAPGSRSRPYSSSPSNPQDGGRWCAPGESPAHTELWLQPQLSFQGGSFRSATRETLACTRFQLRPASPPPRQQLLAHSQLQLQPTPSRREPQCALEKILACASTPALPPKPPGTCSLYKENAPTQGHIFKTKRGNGITWFIDKHSQTKWEDRGECSEWNSKIKFQEKSLMKWRYVIYLIKSPKQWS